MLKFKSHLWYSQNQRNGIFFLIVLIVGFQCIYFFVDFESEHKVDLNSNEILAFQEEIDSLKRLKIEESKPKLFPFNPSFISDYKGYQLGMTNQEIDRLLAFRATGEYINSTKQFQEVTQVSDSLLAVISPYFKFPEWVKESRNEIRTSKKTNVQNTWPDTKYDLNTATPEQLKKINGVGETLSNRIVKYRNSLGGFIDEDQLHEVYNLKPEIVEEIRQHFEIQSLPEIQKLNVNTATFKEVLHLPYIDYELTKKIFQYRDEVAEIQSIEELKNIEDFPLENFEKIVVYLEAK